MALVNTEKMGNTLTPPKDTPLANFGNQLDDIAARLGMINSSLSSCADRYVGPEPEAGAEGCGRTEPSCHLERLEQAINTLHLRAEAIEHTANRLTESL